MPIYSWDYSIIPSPVSFTTWEDREKYMREMEEYNKKKQDQNVVLSSAS